MSSENIFPENEEVAGLFEEAGKFLIDNFHYSQADAASVVDSYKIKCRQAANKESGVGIFHDDDFLLHEGPPSVALIAYYFVIVKGPSDYSSFVAWRKEFLKG
ncbi:MAG TPA: hypothetical protein VGO04_09460 [Ensifer sp.]|jgi:hypothetical protein|uniref:hypothetical protein n=1 Tax=Ensifer sp. TaxID=1872086 RepID=UPI002E14AB0F|nr:hypothetical protein [Ensifer sp.]